MSAQHHTRSRPRLLVIPALILLLVMAALLATTVPWAPVFASHGNEFASTTISPSSQSCDVGTPCSVDIVFHDDPGQHAIDGFRTLVNFDATKLQVTSVTGGGAPFGDVTTNSVNNTAGSIEYEAHGTSEDGFTITVATIVFDPIAAGESNIGLLGTRMFITGFGLFEIGGTAVSGTITVTVAPPTCKGQPATIVGTPGPDVLVGTEGDDVIHGLRGDDTINGGGGNDLICGGVAKTPSTAGSATTSCMVARRTT